MWVVKEYPSIFQAVYVCEEENPSRGVRDRDPWTEGVSVDGQLDGPWLFGSQPRGKWGRTAYWRARDRLSRHMKAAINGA